LAATAYLLPSICAAQEAEPVTVTECGTTVEAGHTAYLLNDIDCRGRGTEGIVLSDRSRLVLAGHVILGDPTETARDGRVLQGVRCKTGSLCAVQGPGAVLGFSASGIAGTRVRVRDVYIADNAVAGISAFENVRVRNVALAANGGLGIHAGGRVSGVGTDADAQPGTPVLQWRSPSRLRDRCATAPSGS
jgi:hypothetical protein